MINGRIINNNTRKKRTTKERGNRILTVTLLCLVLLIGGISPATAEITREVAYNTPEPGTILNVTLHIPGEGFAGIVEELPEGFEYIGSSLPENAVYRSGNTLLFAVVGEDKITYRLRVPDSGSGKFSGKWTAISTGVRKDIPDTPVTVRGSNLNPEKSQESPGFIGPMTLLAFAVMLSVRAIRRR